MATSINVGQSLPLSLKFADAAGNDVANPNLDGPPQWANATPGTGALSQAADGLSATYQGVAAGADTVRVVLTAAGQSFTATLDLTVVAVAPAPNFASVQIVPGTPTP